MINQDLPLLLQKFEEVSRYLSHKWRNSELWEILYSDMCYIFVTQNGKLIDKPFAYTIKFCKHRAINNFFRGKSICSKPRRDITIVSFEQLPECITTNKRFESDVHNKIFVEKILGVLTTRERQVAELIMDGYTEQEMMENLGISQPRVNYLKKKIREKASRIAGIKIHQ